MDKNYYSQEFVDFVNNKIDLKAEFDVIKHLELDVKRNITEHLLDSTYYSYSLEFEYRGVNYFKDWEPSDYLTLIDSIYSVYKNGTEEDVFKFLIEEYEL